MKASVVIRTFNSERTIREVLEGVQAQLFQDYEIVIVDSGSTDATLSIIEGYPHVFVDYSKEEFNYSGSLNAGCAVASGEYVVCLSSHCVPLGGGWLGGLVGAMEEDGRIAGAWGPLVFDVEDYPVGEKREVKIVDLQRFYQRPNRGLQNPNSIVRRSLWEERPFSEEVERCEDQEWARHFLQRGYVTAIVHGAHVLYKIPHSPYQYGKKAMRDSIVLNELFGYRPSISTAELCRRSTWLLRMSVLGKKSPRVSSLFVASMVGRWAAHKVIRYRDLTRRLNEGTEGRAVVLGKLVASRAGRKLRGASRAARAKNRLEVRQSGNVRAGMEQKIRFFLVGEMRSGTSWLSRTLNTHPEVFCRGEGSFFGRDQATEEIPVYKAPTPSLYNALLNCEGLRTWHSFYWNAWSKGDVEEDLRNLTRLTIDYFLTKDSAASGKPIVGDKSPLHTDHVDEIFDFYPGAKVIHIFRDGRDVAVSLMHHFWRLSKDRGGIFDLEPEELDKRDAYLENPEEFLGAGNSIFTEERLRQMAVRWSRRVSKASRDGSKLFGPDFFQLRYEDLLAKPEENLKAMFELLGARSDDGVVRQCVEKNRFERLAKRSAGQEDSRSFFRKGIVGDWRSVFTKEDRRIYEEVAGDTLLNMGYSLD
jgi:glycosyltransferase involved in cell wall biosynthesis